MDPIRTNFLGFFVGSYFIFILALIVLTVYLMISTIQFFKRKTENDRELIRKLDQLIELQKGQGKNQN
jgi:hypothetical protein